MTNVSHCHLCGGSPLEERVEQFNFSHNGKLLAVQDRRTVCFSCGNVSYRGDQIAEHEAVIAAAIRQSDGLLSAEELRSIRVKYKLRQTDMEQMLSIGPKTWTRWERGKVPQSKPTDKLIRAISEDPDLAHRLMIQAGVENSEAEQTFRQIDETMRNFAHASFRAHVGKIRDQIQGRSNLDFDNLVERVADGAFDAMLDARRQALSKVEAA